MQPQSSQYLLSLSNLIKRQQRSGVGFELHVPELVLPEGGLVALMGESGCGKSTLLDLLALVSRPSSCDRFELFSPDGACDIRLLWNRGDDRRLASLRRERIGYILQSGGLLPFLSCLNNVLLPMRAKGNHQDRRTMLEMAERLGIGDLLGKKPQHLSGGQRQRVAVLRALANRPALVLADEPTGAVDSQRAQDILNDFRQLVLERGVTAVIATHDRALIQPFADQIYGFRVEKVGRAETRSLCSRTI